MLWKNSSPSFIHIIIHRKTPEKTLTLSSLRVFFMSAENPTIAHQIGNML
ncbi:MAG TPA: hypothetical protein PLF24_06175 [Ruminococcus sp.]|nr:hypothetical protein [Ruminococcus sp.]